MSHVLAVPGTDAKSHHEGDGRASPDEMSSAPFSADVAAGTDLMEGNGGTNDESETSSQPTPYISCFFDSRRKWVALFAVILVIVGIVCGVVFGVFANSAAPTTEPSTSPPNSTPQSLIELLSYVSFDGGEALQTPSTPQNEAYEWLVGNDKLDSYSDEQKIQRFVLATLYYSTNGDSWYGKAGWLSNNDECLWYNKAGIVQCSSGQVTDLDLRRNNLDGSIPAEVGLLSEKLGYLRLRFNSLSGTIPSETGLLTKLNSLSLGSNDLWGRLPSEIGLLTALNFLYLNSNSLTGTIPSEISLLTELHGLYLEDNMMTGTIPSKMSFLDDLETLYLYGNTWTGEFTCPDFIDECLVSCNGYLHGDCRSLLS